MTRYFSNIWQLRHFWWALVRIDLKNRYRRSMIGVGWSLLYPILLTIVLCFVFSQIFRVGNIWEYGPFLMSGLIFWIFITTVSIQGCQSFFLGESYIRQHPAPLAIYPLRTTLGAGVHLLFGLTVVLVFVWFTKGLGNLPALVNLIPTLILLFLFGWSLGILLGVVNVMFQDSQHLIEVALQMLFYLTPIIYTPALLRERKLDWFLTLNPFAVMLELFRMPILQGETPPLSTYSIGLLITSVTGGAAALTLLRFERRIIFYL